MKECAIQKDGVVIAGKVKIADRYFTRMIGLTRHKKLEDGEAMLIRPCRQIHMFGMKFAIDAVFLSRSNEVVEIVPGMQPGTMGRYVKNACMVLEMKAGAAAGIRKGDLLTLVRPGRPAGD